MKLLLRLLALVLTALAAYVLIGAPDGPIRRASTKRRTAIAARVAAAATVSVLEQNRRAIQDERRRGSLFPPAHSDTVQNPYLGASGISPYPTLPSFEQLLRSGRIAGVGDGVTPAPGLPWPFGPIRPTNGSDL